MLILSVHGGLVSQMRAFYIGYKVSQQKNDELVLDLSDYYTGYYQPYLLDCFAMPDMLRIAFKGNHKQRILRMEAYFQDKIEIVENGIKLEEIYSDYEKEKKYFINNDCCCYDSFCLQHREYFFRYIGTDLTTSRFFEFIRLRNYDDEVRQFCVEAGQQESVGIHVRLRDFVKIGWANEKDFAFYQAAIQWMREHVDKPCFYVFSDDISKARDIIGTGEDITYIQHKEDIDDDAKQLLCLAGCKHKILSKKSGYGLFSSTIGQNKWGLNGYTLIIDNMTLDRNAANYEYVNQNFNNNTGCHQNSDLSNCVSLTKKEIEIYKKRFCYRAFENSDQMGTNQILKCSAKKFNFLFLTLQKFCDNFITGMQRMAKVFSGFGNEVFFVGDSNKYLQEENNNVKWTIENAKIAEDINGNEMGFRLYSYDQLNKKDSYVEFIKYLQEQYGKEFYVIIRKSKVLAECRNKIEGIKYIFIDFTDPYEVEDSKALLKEELDYMYRSADIVITYDYKNYSKWKTIIGNRIYYIDISKYYPEVCVFDEKGNSPLEICKFEDALWSKMYCCILNWIKNNDGEINN